MRKCDYQLDSLVQGLQTTAGRSHAARGDHFLYIRWYVYLRNNGNLLLSCKSAAIMANVFTKLK